jgi:NAD(P)-dependent dehydrogenase (short-subunit alcohol dehydrogenase family)
MSERVAIVAGAGGGGLGRATAVKLAAAGFIVAGVDRSGLKPLDGSGGRGRWAQAGSDQR